MARWFCYSDGFGGWYVGNGQIDCACDWFPKEADALRRADDLNGQEERCDAAVRTLGWVAAACIVGGLLILAWAILWRYA